MSAGDIHLPSDLSDGSDVLQPAVEGFPSVGVSRRVVRQHESLCRRVHACVIDQKRIRSKTWDSHLLHATMWALMGTLLRLRAWKF